MDIFIRNSQALSILDKVIKANNELPWFENYISAAKAFGLRTYFIKDSRFHPNSDGLKEPVKCYGRGNSIGFVERDLITSHTQWIDRWKVFIPESNNIGTELNDDNQNAIVGAPGTICTETYLVVGADLNLSKRQATNCANYLKTKFARFLNSLAKVSQHGTSKTFKFVPLQDFSKSWSDKKLYSKYNLEKSEIDFIDSLIKNME